MRRNIFGWIGYQEHRKALDTSRRHVEAVERAVRSFPEALEAQFAGERERLEEACRRVHAAEREADEVLREMLTDMSQGMFMPADREDLVNLVDRLDDIADNVLAACRLLLLFQEPIPAAFRDSLRATSRLSETAVEKLIKSLTTLYQGKTAATLRYADEVERTEEEADAKKAETLGLLFSSDLPAGMLLLLRDLVEAMENTADRAEDAADSVRLLAVKYNRR